MQGNNYLNNLIGTVVDNLLGKEWQEVVEEWDIVDCEEELVSNIGNFGIHFAHRHQHMKELFFAYLIDNIKSSIMKLKNRL